MSTSIRLGHVQNSTVKLHVTKCLSFSVIEVLVLYLCPQAKVVCTSVFLISVMLATCTFAITKCIV